MNNPHWPYFVCGENGCVETEYAIEPDRGGPARAHDSELAGLIDELAAPDQPWVVYLEDPELVKVREIVREMHNIYSHGAFISQDGYWFTEALTEALGWDLPE